MNLKFFNSVLLLFFISTVLSLSVFGCYPEDTTIRSNANLSNLDGLEKVPEWVLLEVEYALPSEGLTVWIPTGTFQSSALLRIPRFPNVPDGILPVDNGHQLSLESIRNEQVSAQIAVASTGQITGLKAVVSDLVSDEGAVLESERFEVRFVQFLPVHEAHIGAKYDEVKVEGVSGFRAPDVVGDPLVAADQVDVPKLRVQPIWFTFRIPDYAETGVYRGEIKVKTDQYETLVFNLDLEVYDVVIPDPADYVFDLDLWLNPSAIADYYGMEHWSEEHWDKLGFYFADLASRGQNKITTAIVENPWLQEWLHDGYISTTESPYRSMVKWQLLPGGEWNFDYSVFDRYVETSLEYGIGPMISAYSMLAFRGPERITYFDMEKGEVVEERFDLMDDRYEEVWSVFLKDFKAHLQEKGWFNQIHLAFDERPEEMVNRVISVIRNSAPEFEEKIYLSGGMVDPDVADLNISYESLFEPGMQEGILERAARGLPVRMAQTCCSGPHPNRFTFNPASELQMIGWLIMKFGFTGYVDWAYNSWPIDIYNFPVYTFPQGDEYFVYPGPDGPLSSIRWELLQEGIEDFELIQQLRNTGQLDEENYQKAINLATRHRYGEGKDPLDIIKARRLILGL